VTRQTSKAQLLKDIQTERRRLEKNLSKLSAGELIEPGVTGSWSVKDLLAHLAGWDITNLQAVKQILEGVYPSFFQHYDKDWHTYNASLVDQYKIEPFEALLAELDDSHRQLTTYLDALPASDILNAKVLRASGRSVTIRNLLKAEAADESRHALQLRDFFV